MSILPLSNRPDILGVIGNDTALHRVTAKELAGACPKCGGVDRFRVSLERNLCVCSHCHDRNDHWLTPVDYVAWRDGIDWQEAKARIDGSQPGPPPAIAPYANGHKAGDREPWGPVVARYDYRDAGGALLYQVQRHEPGRQGKAKDFSQRRPDGMGGWIASLGDTPRVLYRLPELLATPGIAWLCEGEKDADALAALGLAATTKPGGAEARWRPAYTDALRGREVVILPDKDEPGRKSAALAAEALRPACPAVLVLELPGEGKDVSDWLAAGGTRERLEALAATARAAEAPIFDEIGADDLDRIEFPAVYQPVPGLLFEGATLFSSPPKSGKSITMLGISAALAMGGRALGKIKVSKARVLYLSLEEPRRLTQKRLRIMLGKGHLPADLRLVYHANPLDQLVGDIERYVGRYPETRVVVVDTLAHARGGVARARKDLQQEDYQELVPFSHLGQRLHIAVVLITHSNKGENDDELASVAGSYGLSGAVDSIITLRRKRHESEATLAVFSRELGSEQRYAMQWSPVTLSYILEGNAPELEVTPEQRAVVEFIRAYGTECRSGEIAKGLGISPSTATMRIDGCVASGLVRKVGYGVYALSTESIESVESPEGRGANFQRRGDTPIESGTGDDDPPLSTTTHELSMDGGRADRHPSGLSTLSILSPGGEGGRPRCAHCGHYIPNEVGGEWLCAKCFRRWPVQPE